MKMSFSLENYDVFYGIRFFKLNICSLYPSVPLLPSLYLSVNVKIKHNHNRLSQRCILCGKKAQWRQQALKTETQIYKAIYFSYICGCSLSSYRHFKSNCAENNVIKEESQGGAFVESQQVHSQHKIYVKQKEDLYQKILVLPHTFHVALEMPSALACVRMHCQSSVSLRSKPTQQFNLHHQLCYTEFWCFLGQDQASLVP